MRPRALLLAVVVIASMVAAPAALSSTVAQSAAVDDGGDAWSDGGRAGSLATEPRAVGQLGGTCEYDRLYDQTVQSVVRVGWAGGRGSGFVYESFEQNATSYVVTNQHVVGDAEAVTVTFREGEYATGTVVGRDAYADLAVVRVDDTPAYATPLAVTESVPPPGQPVAALGAPFGLEETITHGIVSGVNRSMPTRQGFAVPDVVQTDAPINPGNSGGPLLTCNGAVAGVNTAGIQAAVGDNVGFAVSAPLIRRVVPALLEDGDVAWPYLGIRSSDVTPAVAEANDLDVARGVVVSGTVPGGPSDGVLQPSQEVRILAGAPVPIGGDVIVGIGGQRVDTSEDLSSFLATETAPGETVNLTVTRDGTREQVTVTLAARPRPQTARGG